MRVYRKIGHRGAAGSRPEHTLPSFERAIELGVDMIELDAQLTSDRRLVVLHDRELGRTVTGGGPVRDLTLDALQAMDSGSWFGEAYAGEPVLSLDEVLDRTAGQVDLNVEIKSPAPDWETTAEVLLALLGERGRMRSTVVSCFDMEALRCVRDRAAEARIGVLWQTPEFDGMWAAARRLGAESVHPYWALIDSGVVAEAHRRELTVLAWTVNKPADMRSLLTLGVDGLISDFPERFPGGPDGCP